MPLHYRVALPILIFTFLNGCLYPTTYKPGISLGKSPVMIRARAQVELFVDDSQAEERGPWMASPARQITDAVVTDFSTNGVFQEVGRSVENPDVIIKGEIHRFHGKTKTNALGKTLGLVALSPVGIVAVPVMLSGVPMASREGSVDIILRVYRRDSTPVGVYSGEGKFSESVSAYEGTTGDRLNKAFTEAIEQIRAQLIADEQKFQTPNDSR